MEIPPLPTSTILLVEVGSTAHGTGLPNGEDLDQIGVVVETQRQALGLGDGFDSVMQRTQPEGVRSGPGDIDRTLHSLRKFVRLCVSGNPSMLLSLFSPIVEADNYGHELRSLSDAFVGRHVIPRYRGYMQSQAQRLLGVRGHSGHGKRGSGQREELVAAHGYDTKYAMHTARLGFQCIELLTTGRLELPIAGEPGDWLRAVRRGDVPFDEWWDRTLELDSRLEGMRSDQSIRPGPQVDRIENWSLLTHQRIWLDAALLDARAAFQERTSA